MRILFQTNRFAQVENGPARFAQLLLQLPEYVPEVEIRVLTEDLPPKPWPQGLESAPVNIPPGLQLLSQAVRSRQMRRRMKQLQPAFAFDVAVYNNALVGLEQIRKGPWPVVGMINDDNNLDGYSFPSRAWLKQRFLSHMEGQSARHAAAIIANSEFLRQRLIAAYGLPPERVHKLYKAVDLRHAVQAPKTEVGGTVNVVFVKSDFVRGGLPELMEALAGLRAYRFKLWVLGFVEQERSRVEAMVPTAAEHLEVRLLGRRKQEEVWDLLSEQADIFCVPSRKEALGVANMEAILKGVPVVSTEVGGIPEVVNGQQGAWLAEPANAQSLARQLEACLAHPQERIRRAEAALEHVKSRFALPTMMQSFYQILNQTCQSYQAQ